MKNKLLLFFGLITVVILAIGYYLLINLRPPAPLIPVKVSLTWLHNAQFAGMYIAQDLGYYKNLGIDTQLIEFSENKNQMEMLSQGQVDFAIINSSELLKAIDKGYNVKAIAVIYDTSPYSLVSLANKNISSPSDFVGKTLGAKGGNEEASILYDILLNEFNVNQSKIRFSYPNFDTSEVDDLVSGTVDVIDVYRTDQLYLFDQQQVKYNLIKPESVGYQSYGDVLVTTSKLINDNPQLVANFVKATIDGWEYALDHQLEAVNVTMKYVSNQYKDQKYQEYILAQSEPLIRPSKAKKIGGMNYIVWRRLRDFFIQNKIINHQFEVNQIYTTEFVP